MSLTKEEYVDQIEIVKNNTVQVRKVIKVMENGKEISSTYHRYTILPGQDYSNFDSRVQTICAVLHTPEVVSEFMASLQQMNMSNN